MGHGPTKKGIETSNASSVQRRKRDGDTKSLYTIEQENRTEGKGKEGESIGERSDNGSELFMMRKSVLDYSCWLVVVVIVSFVPESSREIASIC